MSTAILPINEHINWKVEARVEKFDDVERLSDLGLQYADAETIKRAGYKPEFDELWSDYNQLLNNGINRMVNLTIGTGSIAAYTNATSRIGTGNGVTAVAATDTDMSAAAGAANRWYQAMDATFQSVTAQTITFKSTFASADGNYAWNEWGVDGGGASSAVVGTNGTTTAALLNRVKPASSLGTKASGSSWALTVTITIS